MNTGEIIHIDQLVNPQSTTRTFLKYCLLILGVLGNDGLRWEGKKLYKAHGLTLIVGKTEFKGTFIVQ